jgi:hypothetical protein
VSAGRGEGRRRREVRRFPAKEAASGLGDTDSRPARPAERSRPSGGRESEPARPKTGAGTNSKNKTFLNFIWNSDFWQTLEICTRRFRRDFDMRIFPKIF